VKTNALAKIQYFMRILYLYAGQVGLHISILQPALKIRSALLY